MNLLDLQMIFIPSGEFIRGETIEKCDEVYEAPRKTIWLSDYEIQRDPVTVAMWNQFIAETDYDWKLDLEVIEIYKQIHLKLGRQFSTNLTDLVKLESPTNQHPIVYVSWFDAVEFTNWLSASSGLKYSLPTEAQWEKACRGTNGQYYPWGNDIDIDSVDEFEEIALGYKENFVVGSFPLLASPYGCLDMWTNISEWCLDWFDDGEFYQSELIEALKNPKGPEKGIYGYKVARGGNIDISGWPHCSKRRLFKPTSQKSHIGFRVVRNLYE